MLHVHLVCPHQLHCACASCCSNQHRFAAPSGACSVVCSVGHGNECRRAVGFLLLGQEGAFVSFLRFRSVKLCVLPSASTFPQTYIEAKAALHCGPEVQARAAALVGYLRQLYARVLANPLGLCYANCPVVTVGQKGKKGGEKKLGEAHLNICRCLTTRCGPLEGHWPLPSAAA